MNIKENYRILIIDDSAAIHDDFRKILLPKVEHASATFDEMSRLLKNDITKKSQKLPPFEIDSAYQGEAGFRLVKQAIDENRPYAVAFVDVQMPPGIDGIETISKFWEIDSQIQTVICTAYAKYSWEEIRERFGYNDRLYILKKPFDNLEIIQLASTLTQKWNVMNAIKLEKTSASQPKEISSYSSLNATLESLIKKLEAF
jgi:CheY-like chemotaxis protein